MKESGKSNEAVSVVARRMRCPTCARRYRAQDITRIEQENKWAVFKLRCPICVQERLVTAKWQDKHLYLFYTELDEEEWLHYRHAPPIQSDDVIRMHRNIQAYTGDLSDILEDPLLQDSNRGE